MFRKFSYRGIELDDLLTLSTEKVIFIISTCALFYLLIQFVELVHCRARRRMIRGLKRKPMALIKRIRKSKAEATGEDKPAVIKTHLRNMIIVPEMIGGVVGIHSGKVFNQVEIKVN